MILTISEHLKENTKESVKNVCAKTSLPRTTIYIRYQSQSIVFLNPVPLSSCLPTNVSSFSFIPNNLACVLVALLPFLGLNDKNKHNTKQKSYKNAYTKMATKKNFFFFFVYLLAVNDFHGVGKKTPK